MSKEFNETQKTEIVLCYCCNGSGFVYKNPTTSENTVCPVCKCKGRLYKNTTINYSILE